jgi:predicted nucleic acid-binding protein
LKSVDAGAFLAFSSVITLTEVLTQPRRAGNVVLVAAYRRLLLNSKNHALVHINVEVAEKAAELRAAHNLKTPDALQVAAAIIAGCDAFLTNDARLSRVTELRVLVLDDLEV